MTIEPVRRQSAPLEPDVRRQREELFAELRAESEWARTDQIQRTRALLERIPDGLHDLDAAAQCGCACHPTPGTPIHGGLPCQCQRPPADGLSLAEIMETAGPTQPEDDGGSNEELEQAALEFGIEAREVVPGGPWVVSGSCDGLGYYLRDRGDRFRVVVAPDEDPNLDPWEAPPEQVTLELASGSSHSLWDDGHLSPRLALRLVASVVRTYRRQQACTHPHSSIDRFCALCGANMVEPWTP
ncbi:hypothetical protein [Cellulomonas sp. Leaf334]|uniref:hypothetical protein n=1 Tax=Cellulomonas sp. Leaf334 TaxID=1736339 RepID=UPI0006F9C66D|nr:hypothetical protein [Cellulomonas sp. Leaf334]KQR17256.1 hypothetical protein ASF78_08150 [Cellulomonas sp. Leaf334]